MHNLSDKEVSNLELMKRIRNIKGNHPKAQNLRGIHLRDLNKGLIPNGGPTAAFGMFLDQLLVIICIDEGLVRLQNNGHVELTNKGRIVLCHESKIKIIKKNILNYEKNLLIKVKRNKIYKILCVIFSLVGLLGAFMVIKSMYEFIKNLF